MKTFKLDDEFIQLDKLLKLLRIAQSGGEAHLLVDDGLVKVNGVTENRRRAKLRVGDTIDVEGVSIKIVSK